MPAVRVKMTPSKLIPDGTYEAFVQEPEITQKEDKEFPTLCVTVKVVLSDTETRNLKRWYSYSPKAVWALQQLLDRLEVPYEVEVEAILDEDGNPTGEETEVLVFDPDDLAGKPCAVKVGTKKWQCKDQNEVKEIFAPMT